MNNTNQNIEALAQENAQLKAALNGAHKIILKMGGDILIAFGALIITITLKL